MMCNGLLYENKIANDEKISILFLKIYSDKIVG